jgi:hypothetical protein
MPLDQRDLSPMESDDPERLKMALKIAAENIGVLADHNAHLTAALNTAMHMINLLMDDLRHHDVTPSGMSVVAKATLDQEMERLLRAGRSALGQSVMHQEAADEIERLREEECQQHNRITKLMREIERLQARIALMESNHAG